MELLVRSSCGCVDLQERGTGARHASGDEAWTKLKEKIESLALAGIPKAEARSLQRSWIGAIQNAIQDNRPASELERVLWRIQKAPPPGIDRGQVEAFLLKLHSILMEESAQTMFSFY